MPTSPEELTTAQLLWLPEFWPIWVGITFLFGLFLGSFFNVCIYRIPFGMSVNNPKRSLCYRCGTQIKWYDNIPVFSYLVLRGRCRQCGASYSARYAFVELFTGIMFAAVFWAVNPPGSADFQFATFWYLAFTSLLIIGTFTDFDHWIIPDGVTLGGTVAAVLAAIPIGILDGMTLLHRYGPFPVIRYAWGQEPFDLFIALVEGPDKMGLTAADTLWWEPFANALIGALFGMGLLYGIMVAGRVAFRKDAMGMGDVKLFGLIGGTLGAFGSLIALGAACCIGATVGITMIVISKLKPPRESVLELGSMVLAEEVEGEEGKEEEDWRLRLADACVRHSHPSRVHHLPFGPWIAAGAMVVLLLHRMI